MINEFEAIHALVGGAISQQADGNFIFHDGQTAPAKSAIQTKLAELQDAEPVQLLRIDRDRLLAESDWTALADSALTSEVSAKWKLYRQKLRDLPAGLNTPAKVKAAKWPAKPV